MEELLSLFLSGERRKGNRLEVVGPGLWGDRGSRAAVPD